MNETHDLAVILGPGARFGRQNVRLDGLRARSVIEQFDGPIWLRFGLSWPVVATRRGQQS